MSVLNILKIMFLLEIIEQFVKVKMLIQLMFGQVVLVMVVVLWYWNYMFLDVLYLIIDLFFCDWIVIVYVSLGEDDGCDQLSLLVIVIWVSVFDEVDMCIQEQVKVGVFLICFKLNDWVSGEYVWFFDVIVLNCMFVMVVFMSFGKIVKCDNVKIYFVV